MAPGSEGEEARLLGHRDVHVRVERRELRAIVDDVRIGDADGLADETGAAKRQGKERAPGFAPAVRPQ